MVIKKNERFKVAVVVTRYWEENNYDGKTFNEANKIEVSETDREQVLTRVTRLTAAMLNVDPN